MKWTTSNYGERYIPDVIRIHDRPSKKKASGAAVIMKENKDGKQTDRRNSK